MESQSTSIKKTQTKLLKALSFTIVLLLLTNCTDFIDIDPPKNEITSESVFTDDATAISAIDGIYSEMVSTIGFMSGQSSSIHVLCGLSADEFNNHSNTATRTEFYTNSLTASNDEVNLSLWKPGFKFINYSNALLDGLERSTGLTDLTKNQLEGEAKFVRAFCYFYLVNLFGDIPIITTTDFQTNRITPRSPTNEVYNQIIADFEKAQELLSEDYSFSNGERIRPNKATATAMLSRVYLYLRDWEKAESQATAVIENPSYELLDDINTIYLKNSKEAIWQLMPVVSGKNTSEAIVFISKLSPAFVSLTDSFLSTFEDGDLRRSNWVGEIMSNNQFFYFPFKYKISAPNVPVTEYSMVVRLAEQYLIRAEARAQQNNMIEAIADIDKIRNRSGLTALADTNPSISQPELLDLILHERRIELFSEWGHRWLDLKRTNKVTATLEGIKTNWQPTDIFYPIPQKDRESNPKLTQNEGY